MKSTVALTPRQRQRTRTTTEILDAALEQMGRDGVAGLKLSEVAARIGLAQPSLYRYFPSKIAVYDALFARGMTAHRDLLRQVASDTVPGWATVVALTQTTAAFAAKDPTLADLLFRRTVPGFTPSDGAYAPSLEAMQIVKDAVSDAVARRELAAEAATEDGIDLLMTLVGGVISQEFTNHPEGGERRHLDVVLEMYRERFRPTRRR
jgi:AcrR family transcriptional regulator